MNPEEAHILFRLGWGPDRSALDALRRDGFERWLDTQLAPKEETPAVAEAIGRCRLRINYPAAPDRPAVDEVRPLTLLSADSSELWKRADHRNQFPAPERVRARYELVAATLLRRVYSSWPVRETLHDFWCDHFSVHGLDASVAAGLPAYDTVLRVHALGNFRALLEAVATSPAMLCYLNNRTSRTGGPNENYARELLELHTLGRAHYFNDLYARWSEVPGARQGYPQGYIDQDVYEAARAFTGWTVADGTGVDAQTMLPATGRFIYVEQWHDPYQKRILATELDAFAKPLEDGRKVLDLTAFHPGTAVFMCEKLCRKLVSEAPSEGLVRGAAEVWSRHSRAVDQLARVVRFICLHPEFQQSRSALVRRPAELLVAFAKATQMAFMPTTPLIGALDASGHRLFGCLTPNGYPATHRYWLSSEGMRWRYALLWGLAANAFGMGHVPVEDIIMPLGLVSSARRVAAHTARFWSERLLDSEHARHVMNALETGLPDHEQAIATLLTRDPVTIARRTATLCAMAPAFQMK